ncbi:MAG: hypothetical protein NTW29_16910 [Bacteroidetes bacterium]|nr:hypothetical protein [Bacteroidota bacterium]
MSDQLYITDTPLPLSQNFNLLNEQGFAYIQEHMGPEWTNLNPGDPGVTILEQVCYALTELGYCNEFPVKDILTRSNGTFQFYDQFYKPQQLFTTSPVTGEDYRKYLIDGVTGVENAVITPVENPDGSHCIYKVLLLVRSGYEEQAIADICRAAFYYLNKARNTGELFLFPRPLRIKTFFLSGTIGIRQENMQYRLLKAMQAKINDYIFPRVVQAGYDSIQHVDSTINQILDGPLLNNGYILPGWTGSKMDTVNVINLPSLLLSIPGVDTVSGLAFYNDIKIDSPPASPPAPADKVITCLPDEILYIDLIDSRASTNLTITVSGTPVAFNPELILPPVLPSSPEQSVNLVYGKTPGALDVFPKGVYRDIDNYYSIQQTFPAIYHVGYEGTAGNVTESDKARAKQLKGYLSLADQLLANQFAQLANVPQLFSFKNATTADPTDLKMMTEHRDSFIKHDHPYPVPYRSFSPTYFFQSIYHVPEIRPLLKNYTAYDYRYLTEDEALAVHKSWEDYKEDPYNGYMRRLTEVMRREDNNFERRNAILDHLLARHGESPLLINAIIEGPVYTGSLLKDQVIFKSLYLQNLASLAYNRQKGYNFIGSALLEFPSTIILASQLEAVCLPVVNDETIDFIVFSERIDEIERIKPADIVNYSGAELKLFMLLGLRIYYSNFLFKKFSELEDVNPGIIPSALYTDDPEVCLAYWMISQRKGMLMIEVPLLLYGGFDLILATDREQGSWYFISGLAMQDASAIADWLNVQDNSFIESQIKEKKLFYQGVIFPLQEVPAETSNEITWWHAEHSSYSFGIPYLMNQAFGLPTQSLLFLLPDFVPPIKTASFSTRFSLFTENELPVTSPALCYTLSAEVLWPLAELFTVWYNLMRATINGTVPGSCRKAAGDLLSQLETVIVPSPQRKKE